MDGLRLMVGEKNPSILKENSFQRRHRKLLVCLLEFCVGRATFLGVYGSWEGDKRVMGGVHQAGKDKPVVCLRCNFLSKGPGVFHVLISCYVQTGYLPRGNDSGWDLIIVYWPLKYNLGMFVPQLLSPYLLPG